MKLAYSAWAMPRLPVDQQVEIVRGCGYAGIELVSRADGSLDATTVDAAERARIRGLIEAAGLTLTAIAGHANPIEPDPAQRDANLARVRATIDLAADLGAPCVVTMGYGRPETYEIDRERIAETFRGLAEHASASGVLLAYEPHVGQAIDLPEKCLWLVEQVGSPSFRLNLDNSHFEVMGRDLATYLPVLVPISAHTHLKDQRGRAPDHQFLPPGEGEFDYPRYLRALAEAGYDGFVTVEISVMVQRRPGYDPAETARRSFAVLSDAAERAGVAL